MLRVSAFFDKNLYVDEISTFVAVLSALTLVCPMIFGSATALMVSEAINSGTTYRFKGVKCTWKVYRLFGY
jgi:hypothetical protein